MNLFELKGVLRVTGIEDAMEQKVTIVNNSVYSKYVKKDVFEWNGIRLFFIGYNHVVVSGDIPQEVYDIICSKYPFDYYEISISNVKKNNKSSYSLNIYTKEGLLVFILELKDYYLRKDNLPETELKKYDELVREVNDIIISIAQPSIDINSWIYSLPYYESYDMTRKKWNETILGRQILSAIEEFDKAANVFMNDDLDLDIVNTFIQERKLKVLPYSLERSVDIDKDNCCQIEISDGDKSKVCFSKNDDGFSYQLMYKEGTESIFFEHRYSSLNDSTDYCHGEVIHFMHKKDNNEFGLKYCLTNGMIGKNKYISPELLAHLYDELVIATDIAKKISIDRMRKKEKILEIK